MRYLESHKSDNQGETGAGNDSRGKSSKCRGQSAQRRRRGSVFRPELRRVPRTICRSQRCRSGSGARYRCRQRLPARRVPVLHRRTALRIGRPEVVPATLGRIALLDGFIAWTAMRARTNPIRRQWPHRQWTMRPGDRLRREGNRAVHRARPRSRRCAPGYQSGT
jgi:hypothetical protein